MTKETISFQDFTKIDIRIGEILNAEFFEEARKPAYKLQIDFGELGVLKSSAQITTLYQPTDLIGKQVLAVVNFPKKQIANLMSECLVLGAVENQQDVVLISPDQQVANGTKIA